MTSVTGMECGQALRTAMLALDQALQPPDGAVTAATETQIQTALYFLRSDPGGAELLADLEGVAATLRVMAEARRTSRPNLYASKLARLRRSQGRRMERARNAEGTRQVRAA